jgi:hypothetical protein
VRNRLKAWIGFNDGKCDEDTQLLIEDIKDLEKKLAEAVELIKTAKEVGTTRQLSEPISIFLKSLEEKEAQGENKPQ